MAVPIIGERKADRVTPRGPRRLREQVAKARALDEPLELYDHEVNGLLRIGQELRAKYSHRRFVDRFRGFGDLAQEFEDRARKELGLEVVVDPGRRFFWNFFKIVVPSSVMADDPTFVVWARTDAEAKPFEAERQRKEVKAGVADQYWEERRTVEEAKAKAKKAQWKRKGGKHGGHRH